MDRALEYIRAVITMQEQGDIRYIIGIDYDSETGIGEVKYVDSGGNFHHLRCGPNGFMTIDTP